MLSNNCFVDQEKTGNILAVGQREMRTWSTIEKRGYQKAGEL